MKNEIPYSILIMGAFSLIMFFVGLSVGSKWEHNEIIDTCKKNQRYVYGNRYVLECQLHDINEVLERKYSERL